jgi:hypothetical protein
VTDSRFWGFHASTAEFGQNLNALEEATLVQDLALVSWDEDWEDHLEEAGTLLEAPSYHLGLLCEKSLVGLCVIGRPPSSEGPIPVTAVSVYCQSRKTGASAGDSALWDWSIIWSGDVGFTADQWVTQENLHCQICDATWL